MKKFILGLLIASLLAFAGCDNSNEKKDCCQSSEASQSDCCETTDSSFESSVPDCCGE